MFGLGRKKKTKLDEEIEKTLNMMKERDPLAYSNESQVLAKHLDSLYAIKAKEKDMRKQKVSPDTVVLVIAALIQTGLILKHEELNVITTKAWSQLLKWRV